MAKLPKFKLKDIKKKDLPNYILVNGVYYEKIQSKSSSVEIDLSPNLVDIVKKRMKSHGFVNEAEVIRDVIRRKLFPDD